VPNPMPDPGDPFDPAALSLRCLPAFIERDLCRLQTSLNALEKEVEQAPCCRDKAEALADFDKYFGLQTVLYG